MKPLGKASARPDSVKLRLSAVLNPALMPTPPLVFGHEGQNVVWGDLGNSFWSDCVFAGAAHEHMLWTRAAGRPIALFDTVNVLSDYAAVTGFNYNAATDLGTDAQQAASYRRKTGVIDTQGNRHKIDAYLALRPGDFDQMLLAAYIFGAVGVGLRYPASASQQVIQGVPWTVVHNSPIVGGHYFPVIGRNSKGLALGITWGRLHAMSREFYEMYNDETIAYYSAEYADASKLSPEGFDVATLESFLNRLGS